MTADELKAFLEDNSTAIKKAAQDAIIQRVQDNLRWNMPDTFSQIVNEFLKDEIAPAVKAALMDEKGAIITAMTEAASGIGDQLAKAMTKQAAETLQGYKGADVFKAVLGIR